MGMNVKKMKKLIKKKTTLDKLAIMMSNSFETLRKDINDVKKDVSSSTKVSNLMLKEISAIMKIINVSEKLSLA